MQVDFWSETESAQEFWRYPGWPKECTSAGPLFMRSFRDRLRWGRPGSLTSLDLTSWKAAGVQWTQPTSWGNNLVSTRGSRSNLIVSQSCEHLVDWLVKHPTSLTKMVRDLWKEIGPGPITQTQEQRQKQIYCQKPDRLSCTEKSSSHSLLNVIFYR